MKRILAIGSCLKKTHQKNCFSHLFHFKGYYLGSKISEIKVIGGQERTFELRGVYLLKLKVIKVDQETLITKLLHFKKLMELAN